MKRLARLVSFGALAGTIAPPILFFFDRISLPQVHAAMLVSAAVWFATAWLWMER
jgi:hypothetical protein